MIRIASKAPDLSSTGSSQSVYVPAAVKLDDSKEITEGLQQCLQSPGSSRVTGNSRQSAVTSAAAQSVVGQCVLSPLT